jgi:hypothetical protein
MKKLALLSLALMTSAVVFTSCKKDYVCTCTYTSGGSTSSVSATFHTTKKKATDACSASSTAYGSSYTCKID